MSTPHATCAQSGFCLDAYCGTAPPCGVAVATPTLYSVLVGHLLCREAGFCVDAYSGYVETPCIPRRPPEGAPLLQHATCAAREFCVDAYVGDAKKCR